MTINSIRFDLSDWLIHFFRDIDFEGKDPIIYVEHMGFGNVAEEFKYPALYMLRCAIRSGRLWATWSFRGGARTIYGPHPAVCFSEMPIAAFLETGEARYRRGEAMSQFALIFPKKQVFQSGANPVIYGLDYRSYWPPSGKGGKARILDSKILPEQEQYRYVTYNPASDKPIDWTHEREWRWPFRGDSSAVEEALENHHMVADAQNIPGLDFYEEPINGMGVLVKTREQANWVAHDILTLVDGGRIKKGFYKFILVADELPSSTELMNPKDTDKAISNSLIDLDPYFSHETKDLEDIADKFSTYVSSIEKKSPSSEYGEFGGCWLWILDNTSILTRALIHDDRVVVTKSGKYLVNLYEFSDSRSLQQREEMTKKLAKKIEKGFDIECGYHSVLASDDPDGLPFYADDFLDNRMHYNTTWD